MTREEEEKYCSDMRDLFAAPGWALLVSECRDAIASSDNVDQIVNLEMLYHSKGCKNFALQILALPDHVLSIEESWSEEEVEGVDASYS